MKKILTLIIAASLTLTIQAQNNALDFDGTNEYVNCGNDASLNITGKQITLEAWVYVSQFGDQRIIDKMRSNTRGDNGGYYLGITAGKAIRFVVWATPTVMWMESLDNVLVADKWQHLVATYSDDGNGRIFLDGKFLYANSFQGNDILTTTKEVFLAASDGPSNFLNGKLDEVRIWNITRTPAQLQANMYKSLTGNETGLQAYYKMNETSGTTAADASQNSNTGTLTNMAGDEWHHSSAFAGPRNSLDFDGTNDRVNCGIGSSIDITGDNITLEAWVYPADFNTFHSVIDKEGGNAGYVLSVRGGGQITFAYYNSGWHWLDAPGALVVNKWQHIAVTKSSTGIIIYVDGIAVASKSSGAAIASNTVPLGIGGNFSGGATNVFHGKIDEVRIWNSTRSAAAISDNMCKTVKYNESGLAAYYRFDQKNAGDHTVLYDQTSNGNNGTFVNMDPNTDWVASDAYNTWVGTTSTDWGTLTNWSTGVKPTGTTNVGIPSDASNQPVLNETGTANTLVIGSLASFTQQSSHNMGISGNWVNNGTYTHNSSSVVFMGTSSIGGNSTLEFYNVDILGGGTVNIPTATTVTVVSKTVSLGTLNVKGILNASGLVDIRSTGILNIDGTLEYTQNVSTETFSNAGTVNINIGGTLKYHQATGQTFTTGTVNVNTGGTLTLDKL